MERGKTLICIRRGTQSELEGCRLEEGELGFTTDTHQLFIGSGSGNLLLSKGKKADKKHAGKHRKKTDM